MPRCSRLENMVLAAFLVAEAEGRTDAAERLLQALEALCPGPEVRPPLDRAYRAVGRAAPRGDGAGAPARSREARRWLA